jgi:signal transduction histidine kinase
MLVLLVMSHSLRVRARGGVGLRSRVHRPFGAVGYDLWLMRGRANGRTVAYMASPVPPIVQLARVPGRVPGVDLAIAGGLLLWAVLEGLFAEGPGSTAARVLLAAGFTVPLALRRRWPIPVLLVIAALAIVRGAVSDVLEEGAMPFPALLLGSFSAALYARPRWLAYAAAPVPIVAMPLAGFGGMSWAPLLFLSLTAWTAGFLIRRRAEQLAHERAQGPERAREAVAAERARMARELHDLVAHSVTVISVQAGAAEGLVEREPGKARGHLDAVHGAAHEALVELRRLVGVLREDEAAYSPQPGLDRLDQLLEEARAAGLPVELTEEGIRDSVPAGLDLTAYRIVQESLTNARRHAGNAPTRVRISYGEDRLELEIANLPGRGSGTLGRGGGHGLVGMRERVRLYGGALEAGPTPDGGFAVRADLPLEAPAHELPDREPVPEPGVEPSRGPGRIPRVDIAIAGGLLAWGLLEAVLLSEAAPRAARVLLAVGYALPMAVRRRWPVAALAAVSLLMIARGAAFDGLEDESMPFAVLLLGSFSAARDARSRRWAVAAAPMPVVAIVVAVLTEELSSPPGVDIAILSALAVGAWTAGFLVRRRAEQLALARAQAPGLVREAVAVERTRIAGELHDIVAHTISIVSLQAGAAGQLLEKDPAVARGHLRAVRHAAQEALREMRRLLGVLREDQAAYAPQPGLARLPELVDEARGSGLPVELREEGERGVVPQGVDLAAFRIVQEALANVPKHAGLVPTVIRVRYGGEHIDLSVENAAGATGNGGGAGHGIVGMQERARVYGGTLDATPDGRGGFAVRARLPR